MINGPNSAEKKRKMMGMAQMTEKVRKMMSMPADMKCMDDPQSAELSGTGQHKHEKEDV